MLNIIAQLNHSLPNFNTDFLVAGRSGIYKILVNFNNYSAIQLLIFFNFILLISRTVFFKCDNLTFRCLDRSFLENIWRGNESGIMPKFSKGTKQEQLTIK